MDYHYVYVKLTDNGYKSSTLYWCDDKDPEQWLINDLKLSKNNSSEEWETSLQNVGEAGFDLVCVTSCQEHAKNAQFSSSTRIENIYIFKRKDELVMIQ